MKFVHAADLHLDSALRGLQRYEGAPVERIRGATRRALQRIVDLCLDEDVRLLLFSGDLFDGDWKDYSTGLFFASQMSRLRSAGTRVVLLRGNHDAASQITRHLKLPDHVHQLSSERVESLPFDDLGVVVHGRSFPQRAVTEDLAASYPMAQPGLLNIGMLHTSVTGRPGHEPYAPCSVDELVSKGYDYWALGHVHAREVLHERPWVVFSGNVQGRHAREAGAKGVTLVAVDDGEIIRVEHRSVDVVRWARCMVDLTDAEDGGQAVDQARAALADAFVEAEGRALAARVVLTGQTRAHSALHAGRERWVNEIRLAAQDVDPLVWVEKVQVQTGPPDTAAERKQRQDALGALRASLQALRDDEAALRELATAFPELRNKLPPELAMGEEGLSLDDPALYRELLDDVEQLLQERLLGEDGAP